MIAKRKLFSALVLLCAAVHAGSAQQALNSLAFGVEAGTTGVGVELAMPLVTDHIVFKLGFNAPSLSRNFSRTVSMDRVNAVIDEANAQLAGLGLQERVSSMPDAAVSLRPILNLSTAKLMLELYPFRKSAFHFTVGAYYGMGDNFMTATLSTDAETWSSYNAIRDELDAINAKYAGLDGYTAHEIGELEFSAGDRTFRILDNEGLGQVEATLRIAKLRPYFGIGFGRSVPRGHLGIQLDLGVWYHGVPVVSSANEVEYNPSAVSLLDDISLLDKLMLYPQVSLRLTYRIF
ncbi:MAG TPA: hypothetical protein IAC86_06585 [Candidatus Cryptobacteroides excrementigallinarum]|nr:hypothetical protein [Candidatus Cryptobacteroides excrementigallinarum]